MYLVSQGVLRLSCELRLGDGVLHAVNKVEVTGISEFHLSSMRFYTSLVFNIIHEKLHGLCGSSHVIIVFAAKQCPLEMPSSNYIHRLDFHSVFYLKIHLWISKVGQMNSNFCLTVVIGHLK